MTDAELAAIEARVEKAHDELMRVTGMGRYATRPQGGPPGQVHISIPANRERDTDLLIDDALGAVPALVAEVRKMRDLYEKEQYARAMGCPGCGDEGGTPPHSGDDDEDAWDAEDCPKGYNRAVADTGDYEWICGCWLKPCEYEGCVHGARLKERQTLAIRVAVLERVARGYRRSIDAWVVAGKEVAGPHHAAVYAAEVALDGELTKQEVVHEDDV